MTDTQTARTVRPWPRWDGLGDWPQWDHSGCEHDASTGDREACRRLNRHRIPEGAVPGWHETARLAKEGTEGEFLRAFVDNLAFEYDCDGLANGLKSDVLVIKYLEHLARQVMQGYGFSDEAKAVVMSLLKEVARGRSDEIG